MLSKNKGQNEEEKFYWLSSKHHYLLINSSFCKIFLYISKPFYNPCLAFLIRASRPHLTITFVQWYRCNRLPRILSACLFRPISESCIRGSSLAACCSSSCGTHFIFKFERMSHFFFLFGQRKI